MTYGEIAKLLAKRNGIKQMSTQAVGGAVGRNEISIIVPCHRVVGSNGNLTGYAGGLDKKIALLKLEKVNIEKLLCRKKEQHYKTLGRILFISFMEAYKHLDNLCKTFPDYPKSVSSYI